MDRHSDLDQSVADLLGVSVAQRRPVAGGDVAVAFQVELDDGRVIFAKTHANPPEHFFDTEARGLAWLRDADALPVPQVLGVGTDPDLLLLEWIDEAHGKPSDEGTFGRHLAALHQSGAECFGRTDRRTTGSRGLPNEPCADWVDFFATQRLLPLTSLAVETGTYSIGDAAVFETVADRLGEVGGSPEPPARLHGDLWAGNRVVDSAGTSWLIDPACHGGHREFDLAMMRLFGGFGERAFASYHEAFPLVDGWDDRIELHQLAPLLVHAIKFGGGYVAAARAAALRYC